MSLEVVDVKNSLIEDARPEYIYSELKLRFTVEPSN